MHNFKKLRDLTKNTSIVYENKELSARNSKEELFSEKETSIFRELSPFYYKNITKKLKDEENIKTNSKNISKESESEEDIFKESESEEKICEKNFGDLKNITEKENLEIIDDYDKILSKNMQAYQPYELNLCDLASENFKTHCENNSDCEYFLQSEILQKNKNFKISNNQKLIEVYLKKFIREMIRSNILMKKSKSNFSKEEELKYKDKLFSKVDFMYKELMKDKKLLKEILSKLKEGIKFYDSLSKL